MKVKIDSHVIYEVSGVVEYLLASMQELWDHVDNNYDVSEDTVDDFNEQYSEIPFDYNDLSYEEKLKLAYENDFEPDPVEIFQWYIVSEWMYGRLKEKGAVVLSFEGTKFWGRTTYGQAIYMDGIIKKILEQF